ncbi:MAG: PAS domain S-box protein, partial [Cyanobacteria bacterium P01_C01_bin.73]
MASQVPSHLQTFSASALLHSLLGQIQAPLFIRALDDPHIFCNPAMCALLGQAAPSGLTPLPAANYFSAADTEIHHQVLSTGLSQRKSLRLKAAQGDPVSIRYTRLEDERQHYLLGTVEAAGAPIAGREPALNQNGQTWAEPTLETLPVLIYSSRCDANWTLLQANAACYPLTGYPPASLINNRDRSWASLIHPDDRTRVDETILAAIAAQQPYQLEHRLLHRDGSIRWVQVQGQGVRNPAGVLTHLSGAVFDTTEHHRRIDTLSQTAQTNRALIAAIPDLLIRVRRDGVNLGVLTSGEIDLFSPDQLVDGSRVDASLPPPLAQRRMVAVEAALSTGELQQYEQHFTWRGKAQYEEVRVIPRREDEALVIVRDISARKRSALKLQQLNADLEAQVTARTADFQASQQRLELLIRQSPVAIIEWDLNGLIQGWNPAAETIFGYRTDEVMGQTFERLVPPEDWPKVQQTFSTLIHQRRPVARINENLTRDGQTILCEWHNLPLIDRQNNVVGIAAIATDITQRHQAEKEQAKLLTILEATPDFVGIADIQGQFLYVNQAGRKILGLTEADVLPHLNRIVSPKTSARLTRTIIPQVLNSGIWHGESTLITPTGREIPISQVIVAHRDKQGSVEYLSTIGRDITEQKLTENALLQSERRFRDISEAAGEYIWEINRNGAYTFVTDKAKAVKGYWPSELIGHTPFEFMPPEDIKRVGKVVQKAAAHRQPFRIEHRNLTPTGDIVWEEVNGLPRLNANGEVIGFRGAGMGITQRKQSEIALQKSELALRLKAAQLEQTLKQLQSTQAKMVQSEKMSSLGQLVAGVAHEINNPVSFIHGNLGYAATYSQDLLKLVKLYQQHYGDTLPAIAAFAEAIDLPFIQQDLPKLLNSMHVGAQRIQQIVLSLRTFSRKDESDIKTVDLHTGVDSALMILRSRLKAQAQRPEIVVVCNYGTLPQVECYASQINQVFMNILVNAIDAVEQAHAAGACPSPQITVSTQPLNAEGSP